MANPPFVGRERELAAADELLTAAIGGRGGILLLTGATGLGKTRALDEILERAGHRRAVTARVKNFEHARSPFGPFADMFRDFQHLPNLAPTSSAERALYNHLIGANLEDRGPAHSDSRRLFVIATESLRRASSTLPLLVGIDDFQWADPESTELLRFLGPQLPSMRVVFVVTMLDEPEAGATPDLVTALSRYPSVRILEIPPLSNAEARSIAATTSPAGRVLSGQALDTVVRNADGNPLILLELLSEYERGGDAAKLPRSLKHIVDKKLKSLTRAERHFAEIASVFGRAFTLEEIVEVAAISRPAALQTLRSLHDAGIITENPGEDATFEFTHEYLRTAVHDSLFRDEKRDLHLAVANLLNTAPNNASLHHELFRHYSEAGEKARAAELAIKAAELSMKSWAPASARDHYLAALDSAVLPADELPLLHERLAEAYDLLGDASRAAQHFKMALGSEIVSFSTAAAERLTLRLADSLYRCGDGAAAIALCKQIVSSTACSAEAKFSAQVLLTTYHLYRSDIDEAKSHFEASKEYAVEKKAIDEIRLSWAQAMIAVLTGAENWLPHAERALDLARTLGQPTVLTYTLMNFAAIDLEYGSGTRADDALADSISIADKNGLTFAAAYARCLRAEKLYIEGKLSAALRLILEIQGMHVDAVIVEIVAASCGLFILTDLGQLGLIPSFGDPALLQTAFESGEASRFAALGAAHVHSSAILGVSPTSVELIDRVLAGCTRADYLASALFTLARFGSGDQARRALALFGKSSGPINRAYHSAIEGVCRAREGNSNAAKRAFETSIEKAEQANMPLLKAFAFEQIGRSREAIELYERCGAIAHVRRLTSRKTNMTLTRRESEIAALVKRGLSNRAIADELALSERTVENHLASIYGKAGVRSRAELISASVRA